MIETIGSLIVMGLMTLVVAFAGYVIVAGENEDARKEKNKVL